MAYQLGDDSAFAELYKRHSGRVFGYLISKLKAESQARDVFQSTFLKLHKSRAQFKSNLTFVPWLFTIFRSEMPSSTSVAPIGMPGGSLSHHPGLVWNRLFGFFGHVFNWSLLPFRGASNILNK